jgi:hypothetical protein
MMRTAMRRCKETPDMRTDSPCAAVRLTLAIDSFNVETILDHKVDSNVRTPPNAQPIVA